ncbi:CPBP family intramembrane glutamic endopeptidase [Winogradskyella ouciana]|uniref:CPBP family intramembrane metalloprotease n=1 Tax=Winogradskyella ouciana TaxID=2608631 RepID=A0A7K1GAD2_9FLAO|nr:CPBP family intramembrane glutamic endopeptidase [Winogradskyella ouciana]MTE26103.1 CPBP family intramembrane metalloprotease [Winogradskyella ouciana]
MLGILVLLATSWLLLYLAEKKSILTLGFLPVLNRLQQFITGFLITAVLCVIVQYLESLLKTSHFVLSENFSIQLLFEAFWWDIKSVFTEELIFRGALLYILIKKLGSKISISISAVAFGIYHWFTFGVLGNPMAMLMVFLGTGLMGYAWALAFYKTKSIMLAFGLHLGWNFTYNTVFSKGPLGDIIYISQGGNELTGWLSFLNFSMGMLIVPIIVLIYVSYFTKNTNPT